MLTTNFRINKIFNLSSRGLIVLTGKIISGHIENEMFLINEEKDIRIKINSIEMVNSNDDEPIGLTFIYKDDHELKYLTELKKGDKVVIG